MDVLTDVLESIHVRSLIVGRLECTAPWGLRMTGGTPAFYVLTRGTCWLDVEGLDAPLELAGGDFVVLPKGQPHIIRDNRRTKPVLASEALKACPRHRACQPGGVFQFGGGGARTTLVGGLFRIDDAASNPLIRSLPPIIHVQADHGAPVEWLEATLQFVASEMAAGRPGAETVVSRLADILFVQAVRAHLAQTRDRATGWLRALVDPQIGQALGLIHEQPHQAWTVEMLAERVGMSRSAFAARFGQLVEEPPLTYLTRWRMSKASRLLRRGSSSIGEISGQVGYEAEAAFSKAFKRWHGMSPGMYRRQQAGESASPAV